MIATPTPQLRQSFEEMLATMDAARTRRENRIAELVRDERPRAFSDRFGAAFVYLVHRDTYPGRTGFWRVTRFDREGLPFGHQNATTYQSAIVAAHEEDGDLWREVPIC